MDISYSPEQLKALEQATASLLDPSATIVPAGLSLDEYRVQLMGGNFEENLYAILYKLHSLVETLGPEALRKTVRAQTPDPSLNPAVRNHTQPLAQEMVLYAKNLNNQAIDVLFSDVVFPVSMWAAESTCWGDEDSAVNDLAHQMAAFAFISHSGVNASIRSTVFTRWLDEYSRKHYGKDIIQSHDMSEAVHSVFGSLTRRFHADFSDCWEKDDRAAITKKWRSYGRLPDELEDPDSNREDLSMWIDDDPLLQKIVIEAFDAFAKKFPEKMEAVLKVLEANVAHRRIVELGVWTQVLLSKPVEQRLECYRTQFVSAAEASKRPSSTLA